MIEIAEAETLMESWQDKIIVPARARALANRFILEHLRDGFCAGAPRYLLLGQEPAWAVSILLTRSGEQPKEVGEVLVHALKADLLGFTPPAAVYRNAKSDAS